MEILDLLIFKGLDFLKTDFSLLYASISAENKNSIYPNLLETHLDFQTAFIRKLFSG
jgi:hypothetical protein